MSELGGSNSELSVLSVGLLSRAGGIPAVAPPTKGGEVEERARQRSVYTCQGFATNMAQTLGGLLAAWYGTTAKVAVSYNRLRPLLHRINRLIATIIGNGWNYSTGSILPICSAMGFYIVGFYLYRRRYVSRRWAP